MSLFLTDVHILSYFQRSPQVTRENDGHCLVIKVVEKVENHWPTHDAVIGFSCFITDK